MNFVTIDFETATQDRDSPCEIGLTFIKNNKIVSTKSWLIKPKCFPNFDAFCVSIHGISPKDVSKKPEFDKVWENDVRYLLKDKFVIAHFASFDLSVLRRTLESYKIQFPKLQYTCSYILSKKIWPGMLSYDLGSLCSLNKIQFRHHRAGEDSLACAKLSLKAFKAAGINNFEELSEKLGIEIGRLFQGGYKPSRTERLYRKPDAVKGDYSKNDPYNIFYKKSVVFTGALSSMPRRNAWKIIADIGGKNSETVTKGIDFLIVGQQDFRKVGEDGMSNKQEKAQKLLESGAAIEVMSEADFLRNI